MQNHCKSVYGMVKTRRKKDECLFHVLLSNRYDTILPYNIKANVILSESIKSVARSSVKKVIVKKNCKIYGKTSAIESLF